MQPTKFMKKAPLDSQAQTIVFVDQTVTPNSFHG